MGRVGRRVFSILLAIAPAAAPAQSEPLPHLARSGDRHALIVDGAPFLMLGVQANNSSNYPAMLPKVWPAVRQAQTMRQASDILSAAGVKLHGYCGMD